MGDAQRPEGEQASVLLWRGSLLIPGTRRPAVIDEELAAKAPRYAVGHVREDPIRRPPLHRFMRVDTILALLRVRSCTVLKPLSRMLMEYHWVQ